jgi:hypothetical protein
LVANVTFSSTCLKLYLVTTAENFQNFSLFDKQILLFPANLNFKDRSLWDFSNSRLNSITAAGLHNGTNSPDSGFIKSANSHGRNNICSFQVIFLRNFILSLVFYVRDILCFTLEDGHG